jgi:hypothetical protein
MPKSIKVNTLHHVLYGLGQAGLMMNEEMWKCSHGLMKSWSKSLSHFKGNEIDADDAELKLCQDL